MWPTILYVFIPAWSEADSRKLWLTISDMLKSSEDLLTSVKKVDCTHTICKTHKPYVHMASWLDSDCTCFHYYYWWFAQNSSHVVVICPLQPSSSTNPGCPDPESSVPLLS